MRIVEATIAVLLILVSLVFISSQRTIPENRDIGLVIPSLLDEAARNLSLREEVARMEDEEVIERSVELALKNRINSPIVNLSVELCNSTEVCFLEPYPDTAGDIFSSERVISGSIKNKTTETKRLKVFMWRNNF